MPILDAIGIVTSNLDESLRFYGMLGVPVPEERSDHVQAVLPSGLRLMWDTEELMRKIKPDWTKPVGQGVGLAFLCSSVAEVDGTYAAIVAAGFEGEAEPWDAFWGQRYAQVKDPDGNVVDLFAPLES